MLSMRNDNLRSLKAGAMLSLTALFLLWCPGMLGSETITLTTYYPAPYGGYVNVLATQNATLARDGGGLTVGQPGVPYGAGKMTVFGAVTVNGNLTVNGGLQGLCVVKAFNENSGFVGCGAGYRLMQAYPSETGTFIPLYSNLGSFLGAAAEYSIRRGTILCCRIS